MLFKYFSRQILFSRTFQDSPVNSSTFQACANPVSSIVIVIAGLQGGSYFFLFVSSCSFCRLCGFEKKTCSLNLLFAVCVHV